MVPAPRTATRRIGFIESLVHEVYRDALLWPESAHPVNAYFDIIAAPVTYALYTPSAFPPRPSETIRGGLRFVRAAFLLAAEAVNPLAPKAPMFAPRAKRVIFLFMHGGPSSIDTFDPKPRLDHG